MHEPVDDLYLHIMLGCAHEQAAGQQWVRMIDVANKNAVFTPLVGLTKHIMYM